MTADMIPALAILALVLGCLGWDLVRGWLAARLGATGAGE